MERASDYACLQAVRSYVGAATEFTVLREFPPENPDGLVLHPSGKPNDPVVQILVRRTDVSQETLESDMRSASCPVGVVFIRNDVPNTLDNHWIQRNNTPAERYIERSADYHLAYVNPETSNVTVTAWRRDGNGLIRMGPLSVALKVQDKPAKPGEIRTAYFGQK
ncbi:MAG: hypothetical protein ABIA93_04790 [Candidatus Woesearchaeota archaeon]